MSSITLISAFVFIYCYYFTKVSYRNSWSSLMLISEMYFSKIQLIARKVTDSYLGQQHTIIVSIYYVVHKVTYSHFKATIARIYHKIVFIQCS